MQGHRPSFMEFRELLDKMAPDSRSTLEKCLLKKARSVRFFSYGSNMNENKFKKDMNGKIELVNRTTVTLAGFKRTLSNRSKNHGVAFSISCSPEDKVEGICHDVPIELLEDFLKKEGVLKKNPSYRVIEVTIPDQNEPILTLCGLRSTTIADIRSLEKAEKALNYVEKSIEGAECCNVKHLDMKKNMKELQEFIKQKEKQN